mmetsp:Transcript_20370/g.43041  ORF Transcript_20370/g.43041 Transcript_20370/m.43041 type:complete len:262 (-) Transcript_20370:549-1334(-)
MAVSRILASVLLLIADSAMAHPEYWVTRDLGYGGCGNLITELTPAQLQNEGMFGSGFLQVEAATDATLAADGESYEIPIPAGDSTGWMVTAKEGFLGPLPGEPDRSRAECPNLFQTKRQNLATSPAVLWTPPAGASGDYTIDVGFAPGFGVISYTSYTISLASAELPAPSPVLPPPSPVLSPPTPVLSPPTPVVSPPAPIPSPPLPILSPPSPDPIPSAPTLCTGADADCPDGFTCNCYAVGSRRKILFASTPETCVCEAR